MMERYISIGPPGERIVLRYDVDARGFVKMMIRTEHAGHLGEVRLSRRDVLELRNALNRAFADYEHHGPRQWVKEDKAPGATIGEKLEGK